MGILDAPPAPVSVAPTVIQAGALGATHTIDFAHAAKEFWIVGTLNNNCVITITNEAIASRAFLLLTQDSTGGWTLNVSDGTTSLPVAISSTAGAFCPILVDCPTTTDVYVTTMSS